MIQKIREEIERPDTLRKSENQQNNGCGRIVGKSLDDFIVDGKEIVCNDYPIDNEPQFNLII